MSNSPKTEAKSSIPWTVTVPAIAALLIGSGAIMWTMKAAPTGNAGQNDKRPIRVSRDQEDIRITEPNVAGPKKFIPRPDARPDVHSMNRAEENGIKLVLIRLVPGGDELVLDAATGKLLQTRPSSPNRGEAKNFTPPTRLPGLRHLVAPMGANGNMVDANRPATSVQ